MQSTGVPPAGGSPASWQRASRGSLDELLMVCSWEREGRPLPVVPASDTGSLSTISCDEARTPFGGFADVPVFGEHDGHTYVVQYDAKRAPAPRDKLFSTPPRQPRSTRKRARGLSRGDGASPALSAAGTEVSDVSLHHNEDAGASCVARAGEESQDGACCGLQHIFCV
jgi:hypothetical protein